MNFYSPLSADDFLYERCFLCGINIVPANKTVEHIFPKWLQHRYTLWDEELIILNNTKIKYRFLTVPCCKECNNVHLAALESKFSVLHDRKFENLTFEDELVVFQWSIKILYSTMYKELSLKFDRANPSLGNILQPKILESYRMLHLFLQSLRVKTVFHHPKPWSLFVFNLEKDDFDYTNDILGLGFSIKFGNVGNTIVFEDNNIISDYLYLFNHLNDYKLSDLKFWEVTMRIFFAKRHMRLTPTYIHSYNTETEQLDIHTLNSFGNPEWDDELFSYYFEALLSKRGYEDLLPLYKDNMLKTFLVDADGELYVRKIKRKIGEL